MAKVMTPRELSRGARHAFSNPKQLKKIFHSSLKEDLIETSQSITKEYHASSDIATARKARETKEYSKMLSTVLDDEEKQEPKFTQSMFNLSNIERNLKPCSSASSSSSSFIMNNSSFFVSDDFSQCFDEQQTKQQRKRQSQPKKLLDDEEEELSGMFDRLSTSESEG